MPEKTKEKDYHLSEGRRKPRYARSQRHEIPESSGEEILEKTRTEKGRVITSRTAKQS